MQQLGRAGGEAPRSVAEQWPNASEATRACALALPSFAHTSKPAINLRRINLFRSSSSTFYLLPSNISKCWLGALLGLPR